jgi:hypothetical protein
MANRQVRRRLSEDEMNRGIRMLAAGRSQRHGKYVYQRLSIWSCAVKICWKCTFTAVCNELLPAKPITLHHQSEWMAYGSSLLTCLYLLPKILWVRHYQSKVQLARQLKCISLTLKQYSNLAYERTKCTLTEQCFLIPKHLK